MELINMNNTPYVRKVKTCKGIYKKIKNNLKEELNIDEVEYRKRIQEAQYFHNPLNFDSGDEFRDMLGVEKLFTDYLTEKRYYFPFHEVDMTDEDVVIAHFFYSKGFKKYSKIWKKHAPDNISHLKIYLLAITEMSVKGFKHEETELEQYRKQGKEVKVSSAQEDYYGIDAYVDGEPIQIKSPGTVRAMKNR